MEYIGYDSYTPDKLKKSLSLSHITRTTFIQMNIWLISGILAILAALAYHYRAYLFGTKSASGCAGGCGSKPAAGQGLPGVSDDEYVPKGAPEEHQQVSISPFDHVSINDDDKYATN